MHLVLIDAHLMKDFGGSFQSEFQSLGSLITLHRVTMCYYYVVANVSCIFAG